MNKAVEKLDHFPSISQLEEIAQELGIRHGSGWKYLEVADCLHCGGCGWHWAKDKEARRGVLACDFCEAGKNLQKGPKGQITHTLKQCNNVTYDGPGR